MIKEEIPLSHLRSNIFLKDTSFKKVINDCIHNLELFSLFGTQETDIIFQQSLISLTDALNENVHPYPVGDNEIFTLTLRMLQYKHHPHVFHSIFNFFQTFLQHSHFILSNQQLLLFFDYYDCYSSDISTIFSIFSSHYPNFASSFFSDYHSIRDTFISQLNFLCSSSSSDNSSTYNESSMISLFNIIRVISICSDISPEMRNEFYMKLKYFLHNNQIFLLDQVIPFTQVILKKNENGFAFIIGSGMIKLLFSIPLEVNINGLQTALKLLIYLISYAQKSMNKSYFEFLNTLLYEINVSQLVSFLGLDYFDQSLIDSIIVSLTGIIFINHLSIDTIWDEFQNQNLFVEVISKIYDRGSFSLKVHTILFLFAFINVGKNELCKAILQTDLFGRLIDFFDLLIDCDESIIQNVIRTGCLISSKISSLGLQDYSIETLFDQTLSKTLKEFSASNNETTSVIANTLLHDYYPDLFYNSSHDNKNH